MRKFKQNYFFKVPKSGEMYHVREQDDSMWQSCGFSKTPKHNEVGLLLKHTLNTF